MMNILNKFKSMFMFIYVDHVISTLMCFMGSPLILLLVSYLTVFSMSNSY